MLSSATRLPGIVFHTETPLVGDDLPRMDIAGFVGFSERGPVHTPVAIEDYAQYREIFGEDIALAWDPDQKRMQHSLLGASVESFFRNGGRRCWIVRVAKEYDESSSTGAITQHFMMPGMFRVTESGDAPATILARSPGSWADNLRVGTRLVVRSLTANPLVETTSPPTAIFDIDDGYTLHIKATPADLAIGDLVEMRFADSGLGIYLFIDELSSIEHGLALKCSKGYWYEDSIPASPYVVSPPEPNREQVLHSLLTEEDGQARYDLLENQTQSIVPVIRRLRFDILVWERDAISGHLVNLAFDKRHPRFWGNLPDDKLLYGNLLQTDPVNLDPGIPEFLAELSHPRFPLAAVPAMQDEIAVAYLPLMMLSHCDLSRTESAAGSTALPTNPRDGLEVFTADLFLDKDMAQFSTTTVLREAEYKRFIRKQDLTGIHSLLPIDEVSMIAVPDCVHRHWDLEPPGHEYGISAPHLNALSVPDEYTRRTLSWSQVAGIRRYTIQKSLSPDFTDSEIYTVDRPTRLELTTDENLPDIPDTEIKLLFNDECPKIYYFRLRAEAYGRVSPWSNTRAARIPEASFYNCQTPGPYLLGLSLDATFLSPGGERLRLSWIAEDDYSRVDTLAENYQLQRATDTDFVTAETIYEGADLFAELSLLSDETVYYRVRAISSGTVGPWSNSIVIPAEFFINLTLNETEEYDQQDLLAVQYALVRLCAARADAIAILSTPVHYQPDDVSEHLDALIPPDSAATPLGLMYGTGDARVPVLNWQEQASLSYSALYYPWLSSVASREFKLNDKQDNYRIIPPEGAVCGKMAASAIQRGAWIASANNVLHSIPGLSHQLTSEQEISLLNKQVNIIHPDVRGFVVINDDTLSMSNGFKPIVVRRLMTLLRRLVEREGNIYVFEPNSNKFRYGIENYWKRMLVNLYQRGALKGETADAAFRIVTDESVNDERSRDVGRFIIELHVAPSEPMKFINIRLVQSGPDQLLVQEL